MIRYSYDHFCLGEGGQDMWRITQPREYIVVSNRFIISRKVLEDIHKRIVLQQVCLVFLLRVAYFTFAFKVTYQSEAEVRGVERRQLKDALFINWLMRHYREHRGYQVMEMTNTVIEESVNLIRQEGLFDARHMCHSTGPVHVPHIARKGTEAQTARILRTYESVIVMDGHEKLNRAVCQHRAGERELHPQSGLRISAQCSGVF